MNVTWTLRAATLLVAAASIACGAEAEPEPADSPDATAEPTVVADPTAVVVDLKDVPWAVDLAVNLDEMSLQQTGLYVQVLAEGQGPRSTPGDSMGVHYRVWLPNGSLLDASYDHTPPEPLPMVLGVTQLIDGWTQGVSSMRVGERRRLVVPFDLAYGPAGRPGVPPYSPLLFELELMSLVEGELPAPDGGQ
jgi:hypothetical protein